MVQDRIFKVEPFMELWCRKYMEYYCFTFFSELLLCRVKMNMMAFHKIKIPGVNQPSIRNLLVRLLPGKRSSGIKTTTEILFHDRNLERQALRIAGKLENLMTEMKNCEVEIQDLSKVRRTEKSKINSDVYTMNQFCAQKRSFL